MIKSVTSGEPAQSKTVEQQYAELQKIKRHLTGLNEAVKSLTEQLGQAK